MLRFGFLLLVLASPVFGQTDSLRLDLSQPADAVKALQKMQCSLNDAEPAVYYFEGSVFSRVPGERDRKLFTYEAFNIRACQSVQDEEQGYGYQMVSREILLYTDPDSGEILRTWLNPWTREELDVIHVANDPVNTRVPIWAMGRRGPFDLGATIIDGKGWLRFEVPVFYANPLGGAYQEYVGGTYQSIEIFNFFFDEEDLLGPSATAGDTFIAWNRVSKWLPWMKMNDRAGYLVFSGSGKRIGAWDELPAVVKDEVLANYPAYTEPPPVSDTRSNATSWTVFKQYIDAKRAQTGRANE
ncbi:MAG: DUF1838 family protein [Bacteroidota bacterium]